MKKAHELFYNIVKYMNSTVLFSMFFIILLQVFYRKVLGNPLTWPEEIALLTMIWVTFIGAYQSMYEKGHLKMSFIEDKLSARGKSILLIFSKLIVISFLAIANYWALPFIKSAGKVKLPITDLPMALPYGIIWLSLLLMLIEVVIQIIIEIRYLAKHKPSSEEGK